jgi:hypothetical protein
MQHTEEHRDNQCHKDFQGNAAISWVSNAALAMIEEMKNAIAIEHCNSECIGATSDPMQY